MDQQPVNDTAMVVRESVPSSDTVRVRFGEIDGLRAIAIIAALIYEATRIASPGGRWWPPFLARVYDDASQGLSLFFVISGFVLAYPAFATQRQDGRTYLDIGRYLVKRALRIYPAYLVVLALSFVVPPLAMQYGLPALAHGTGETGWGSFVANVVFAGSGLQNDGFRTVALEARWFVLLPVVLLVWTRFPKVLLGFTALVMLADSFLAFIHATGVGTLAAFTLGVIAADVRAGHLRFEKYAFPVAGGAALLAILLEPFVANLPGPAGAPGALRVDPLWTIALFALVIGAGTSAVTERIFSIRPLRFIGAGSYGIALAMVPVSGFIVRQTLSTMGQAASAANAVVLSTVAGLVVWQLADRWFAEGNLRQEAAAVAGPFVDSLLRAARIDRVTLGEEPELVPYAAEHIEVDPSFYAPPPRPENADLASVSRSSGSAEDLANEIMDMKKRLQDRSSAIFAEPEARPEPVREPEPFSRPGFYKRSSAAPAAASAGLQAPSPAAQAPVPNVFGTKPLTAAPAPAAARVPASAPVTPAAPVPAPSPQRPRPVAPAYREPQPISPAFEATAPQSAPRRAAPAVPAQPAAPTAEYQHYALEPATAPAPPQERTLTAVPPLAPAPPTNRGPIKMRIGALPEKVDGKKDV